VADEVGGYAEPIDQSGRHCRIPCTHRSREGWQSRTRASVQRAATTRTSSTRRWKNADWHARSPRGSAAVDDDVRDGGGVAPRGGCAGRYRHDLVPFNKFRTPGNQLMPPGKQMRPGETRHEPRRIVDTGSRIRWAGTAHITRGTSGRSAALARHWRSGRDAFEPP
jgi:hypothetical protein